MREAHPNADDATLQDQTTVLIRAMDYNVATLLTFQHYSQELSCGSSFTVALLPHGIRFSPRIYDY
jgi:hypothetical protein